MGSAVLVVLHQAVQIKVSYQLEAVDVLPQFACDFLLTAADEVAEVSHFLVQVVGVVEAQDLPHPQHEEIVIQTFLGNADHFGRVGEVASLGFVQFPPDLDCLDHLPDSPFTLFGLFVAFLTFVAFVERIVLFDLRLVDHPLLCWLLRLHQCLYLAFVLVLLNQIIDFLHGLDLLEATIVVLVAVTRFLLILLLKTVVFSEDIAGLLGDGVCLHEDIGLIQGLKLYSAEGIRFNDGVELGNVEFFALDDQSLGREVDQDFAQSDVAELFELRDVHVEGASELFFINDDEFAADLVAAGRKMPEFVIVNTHNKYYKDFVHRSYSFACTLSRLNSIYGKGGA